MAIDGHVEVLFELYKKDVEAWEVIDCGVGPVLTLSKFVNVGTEGGVHLSVKCIFNCRVRNRIQ